MATGYIAGIFGTGGSSSTRVPVVVSGSPFADYDALYTWSQANPSELLNNSEYYATAELDDGTNYQWEGVDGVYSANGWIRVNELNNEEQEAVDSIVDAPDNEILVTDSGTLVSKGITVSDTDIDTNGRSITVSVGSLNLGGAQSISAAGRNVATKDLVSQDSRHSVWQTFEDGNTAIVRVRTTLPPITVSDKTADLVNPVWTQAAATVDQTVKQVVLDFTNAVTNFVVELDIDGVNFFKENLGDFSSGEQTVVLNPPTDVFQGDVVTFKLTSEDGDVTVKGNSGTGVPYQVATIASWVDESISGGSGDVTGPASSIDTELSVFNGTDGDAIQGSTKIKADISSDDSLLILGTNAAIGSGFPAINFNDSSNNFLASIGYDESVFGLHIVSDSDVSIDASGAMSFTASGAISHTTSDHYTVISSNTVSLNSNGVSISGADTTEINSNNDMTLTSIAGYINIQTSLGGVNISTLSESILLDTGKDVVIASSNDDTNQSLLITQTGSNGGKVNFIAGARSPSHAGVQGGFYLRQGSSSFQSDIYVCDEDGVFWVPTKGRGSPYLWGNSNVQSGTTTRYLTPGNDDNNNAGSNESNNQIAITRSGFFHNMRVRHGSPDGNGNTIQYMLMVNGSTTAMLVNLASTGTIGTSTTRIEVNAGDLISIRVTKAIGVSNSPDAVTCMIDFY